VGRAAFGGDSPVLIAGPCSVEDMGMLRACAAAASAAGASMLRGGAFKPRTSPYTFQGLGIEALRMLAEVRAETGLPVVSEVLATDQIEPSMRHIDMIQVGSRNMHNFPLLTELGRSGFPVLLKRGFMATVEEWILAAEYILKEGNDKVVLCERGIRTFEHWTRNTFDVAAIPLARMKSGLPVIADPCHASGRRDLVKPLSLAAMAAGADGLMIEIHPDPARAASDGDQSLGFEELVDLSSKLGAAWAAGRQ
jgi:3-deoxy-7-phosphoheptulonate synthase